MLARWLGPAALAAVLWIVGCGGAPSARSGEATGNQLAVYSSLPLQGPSASISQQIVNGEKLALAQAGGHVGPFKIGYVSLDDADPATGLSTPGIASADAKTAAQDTSTIAYLGDYGSAATAISLPLINAAGILQVSPASPYVGLTSSLDAGQDEPGRFYLSGLRNFARLQPGDVAQASAQAQLMSSLGVHNVYVLDDQDPFEVPLARIAAARRRTGRDQGPRARQHRDGRRGDVHGRDRKDPRKPRAGGLLRGRWRAGHAGAVAGAASRRATSAAAGHERDARAANSPRRLGAAAANTYLTSPVLPVRMYPPSAQRVLRDYRRVFGAGADAHALYGYEAMSVVLSAIRSAGSRGNDRRSVIMHLLATHDRESVLGRYSFQPDGETTLSRYAVDRVSGGRAVFYRALQVAR